MAKVLIKKIIFFQDLTNLDLFLTSRDVEAALLDKDTSKCLLWCQDNKSRLKKIKVPRIIVLALLVVFMISDDDNYKR